MKQYVGVYIAVGFFILQIFLAGGAGASWDEPQNFFNGKKTLRFFQTGNRAYVETWGDTTLFKGDHMSYLYADAHYPPGAGLISAIFSYILSDYLHVTGWIHGFHIGEIAIGAVGIGTFYYLGVLLGLSPFVACVATLLLAFHPTIFGQMRADSKDIPMMSALIVFVYLFFRWITSGRFVWRIAAFVALGVAIWMKPTAAVILVPVAIVAWRKLLAMPILLIISACVIYVLWPYVWDDPVGKITASLEFFRSVGKGNVVVYLGNIYNAGFNLPWHYPWVVLGVQTPVEILFLSLLGMVAVWKKKHLFVLLWLVLGMSRFVLPGVVIYAKIRHFIDVMPAFFLLVGFGLQWLHEHMSKRFVFGVILFAFVHLAWIHAAFYPYEVSYFNMLVGGTRQVAQRGLFDVEHWATGTREAVEFINQKKGEQALYGCGLNHLAKLYTEPHVRVVATPQAGSYILIPNMPSVFLTPLDFYKKHQTLVYTIRRADADLFYVYQVVDPTRTWMCGGEVATGEDV